MMIEMRHEGTGVDDFFYRHSISAVMAAVGESMSVGASPAVLMLLVALRLRQEFTPLLVLLVVVVLVDKEENNKKQEQSLLLLPLRSS